MDTVAIATLLVESQASMRQGQLAASLVNMQNNQNNQVVALLDNATQSAASVPPMGTGEYLNIIA